MKKFLNSVWGVAFLCVVGAGLVAWRVVLPLLDRTSRDSEWAQMEEEDDWLEEVADFAAVRHTLTTIDVANLNWNTEPVRDPFALRRTIKPKDLTAMQTKLSKPHRPTVTALVAGSSSKLAIVDGELVGEGDRVGRYRVTDIGVGGVRLLNEANGVAELIRVN